VVALALLSAVCTIGFSYHLALFISDVFAASHIGGNAGHLVWVAAFGLGRAALIWVQELLSVRASIAAKLELRTAFYAAIQRLGAAALKTRPTSDLVLLANQRIDALDSYFARFLPSLVSTVLVTPIMTAAILLQDFWSGITVICTLPLIPLFMIFIGWATQEVQQRQLESLRTLTRHFTQVLRGLTTLRVFGRLPHQPAAIAASSEQFRVRTMRVLRMSFLSGMALEVAASLSVALVAVSIGLRLIDGSLALGAGLLALLLAPEAFLPLRQVGANFHASNEGVLASKEILDLIEQGNKIGEPAGSTAELQTGSTVNLDLFSPAAISHLTGASGAGKTTFLAKLRTALPVAQVAWMPQGSTLLAGTVKENIVGLGIEADQLALQRALELAALDDVELEAVASDASAGLSGGQVQRVALARVFYRALTRNVSWLLLDEPLSALDAARARTVKASFQEFAKRGLRVVVVSHQKLGVQAKELAVSDVQ